MVKTCKGCQRSLELNSENFYEYQSSTNGRWYFTSRCRECHRKYNTDKKRKQYREDSLKGRYGLSQFDYDLMLKSQDGVCAICKKGNGKKKLCVDHCHKSGKIRKLLCDRCNHGLGHFFDNPDLLEAAAVYVRKHQ